jgi:protein-S-isoprenylcysteine O-methyltransferase Ste14
MKRLRIWAALSAVLTVVVLGLSGRWEDPWLLTYCAIWSVLFLGAMLGIDDDLARERFAPPEPGADRLPLRAIRLAGFGHVIVGALDAGWWHVSDVPAPLRMLGLAGMTASAALVFAAMHTNRFFSPVVRLQRERGHAVIDRGIYGRLRHPGYAGMMAAVPCSALALGSWPALAVACVYSALIARRVLFEDAFLRAHLEGYAGYADRVRARVIPGVW